jgi:hypothetical protein
MGMATAPSDSWPMHVPALLVLHRLLRCARARCAVLYDVIMEHLLARTIPKSEAIPREIQGLCPVLTHLGCP